MTKFEHVGVEQQNNAAGKSDAKRRFAISCQICCARNIRLDCDHCAIRESHLSLMAYYAEQERGDFQCEIQYNGKGRWKLTASAI